MTDRLIRVRERASWGRRAGRRRDSGRQQAVEVGHLQWPLGHLVDHHEAGRAVEPRQVVAPLAVDGDAERVDAEPARLDQGLEVDLVAQLLAPQAAVLAAQQDEGAAQLAPALAAGAAVAGRLQVLRRDAAVILLDRGQQPFDLDRWR
jgi:hypothetical protein